MLGTDYLLAIDQGTSSSRAVVFDQRTLVLGSAQQEFPQHYPRPGWVEHDPEDIRRSVAGVIRGALQSASVRAQDIRAIGITNQRETTFVWDRKTGEPVYNAIVWQDRRTASMLEQLQRDGAEDEVVARTGLRLDPYFSASKLAWILTHVDGARARADRGELAFGTADSFLIWHLTGGRVHATDATNASRTLLFNIHTQSWDEYLLALFDIPVALLPDVRDCVADYGQTRVDEIDAAIPIAGVAGDQQSALIGQAGVEPGMLKSTYGTGCFVLANTGEQALRSGNQLLTTVASRFDGAVRYGLEGSVFVAGSAVQWLRDSLQLIESAAASEAVAEQTGIVEDVHMVPAFTGLGAPYWDPHARGAILGLTRGSGRGEIVTATLQAIAYQTVDLIKAMSDDGIRPSVVRVDGGMVANNWFLQFLADILGLPVERPLNVESTVLGAAYLAAIGSGVIDSVDATRQFWRSDRIFKPSMSEDRRASLLLGWANAVAQVRVSQ